MEYSPGTTQYNGNGVELLKDLDRAGFLYFGVIERKNTPTLIAESLDRIYKIGIQRENGSYVIISVDDSVDEFTRRVEQRRETEIEFQRTLIRTVTRQNLEQLTIVNTPSVTIDKDDEGRDSQGWRH